MSGTTTRLALPYPGAGDGPDGADVPYWMEALAVALDGAAVDDQGVFADRPVSTGGSPGIAGRYYMVKGDGDAAKNGVLWRDNGTGWDRVSPLVSADPANGTGYATGAGGSVTQATSKSTAVTINKVCGEIITHGASLALGARAAFGVNNSAVAATDVVVVSVQSAGNDYTADVVSIAAGAFRISLLNTGTTRAEAVYINFAVIKAVAS